MKQLELCSYSRAEIAKILDVNIDDTNHFKRNVEAKLQKWGYSYEYSRKSVTLTKAPSTADERLAEILIREYDIDVRIDTYAFATFFYSLVVFPEFTSMPWEERAKWLADEFRVEVSDRTLRSWCSRLISSSTVCKDDSIKTRWITTYYNGEKDRQLVDGDELLEEFADNYYATKLELLKQYKDLDNKEKWDTVRRTLWDKYKYCVYYCKGISLAAFDSTSVGTLQELIELVNEIAEREPVEVTEVVSLSVVTKPIVDDGEFHF